MDCVALKKFCFVVVAIYSLHHSLFCFSYSRLYFRSGKSARALCPEGVRKADYPGKRFVSELLLSACGSAFKHPPSTCPCAPTCDVCAL